MKSSFTASLIMLISASLPAISQETKTPHRLTNDHYFDFERVSNAQISPDGAHIVYTRQQANKIEDRWDSSLWIMNADGSQNRFLTKGARPGGRTMANASSISPMASRAVRKYLCAGLIPTARRLR